MSRFNTRGHAAKPAVATAVSPMGTTSQKAPDTRTFEGGAGWTKDAKTNLFLRTSASFNDGGNKFYESGYERDEKLRALARQVAVEDFTWFAQFVKWLRRTANIRTSAIMVAADGVKARLDAGEQGAVGATVPDPRTWNTDAYFVPTNRSVIDSVLYRADEPGEMLAYWMAQYGRRVPKPVKRGVADAATRLYTERAVLKYDTASHRVRFGDVLNIAHATPSPDKMWQGDLFQYALDRRYASESDIPESLRMVRANRDLHVADDVAQWLDPAVLSAAGATWESALSAVGGRVDKRKLWEAMIPSMGYMALLMNLRNFDEAGISNKTANEIIVKLVREDEVAKSRQLPFRFLSAYKNAPSLRWGHALETALDLATTNIPALPGRTLILTDTSESMMSMVSEKSTVRCLEAAGLFASALALRNAGSVDMYQYADRTAQIVVPKGGSALRMTAAILGHANQVGWGTDIAGSVRNTYRQHDRVVILSDGQGVNYGTTKASSVAASVPPHVPVYLFNIEGYSASPMPTGTAARFDLGGLSDQTFKLIPLLEQGVSGDSLWPWEINSS